MSRYFRRETGVNDTQEWRKKMKERGTNTIEQYRTPVFKSFDLGVLENIETYNYIFQKGDSFWKIAKLVYGDPRHWWVVAAFNRIPTTSHLKSGDVVRVPLDLASAIEALE